MTTTRLIHGDAVEQLALLADDSFDTLITDPPYNEINERAGDGEVDVGLRQFDKGIADSALVDIPRMAAEFVRVTRGSIYVWCGPTQFSQWHVAFRQHGLTTRTCIWWKTNPSPVHGEKFWLSALETCVFARKSNAPFFRHCKPPAWYGVSERVEGHPTPKPLWLMHELVTASTPRGGSVLDPFMGSGSTGVAALRAGRTFVGIDYHAPFVALARARLQEALTTAPQSRRRAPSANGHPSGRP